MPAPTRTDVFAFLLFIGAQVLLFELWPIILRDGFTISLAIQDWAKEFPWLETVTGLLFLFLWLHFFRHDWLIAAWDWVFTNG